jgi:hypothetical protein
MDWVIAMTDANDHLELPTEGPLLDRSNWKAKPSLPAELDPVLDRVKTLARGSLMSMMVLGDFLRRRIAPLQQRSRMACMFTGVNDCSRIVRGAGSNLSGAELEVLIRAMTGEAYAPELLVLPRGIKALCEDQAMRTAVLASLSTLDEGSLAVQQVRGDPNRGIRIPGTSPDSHQRADLSPSESSHGGPAPSGKEKVPEAATSQSSWDREEDRSRRLRRGDGSFMGEPAPKLQKMTELGAHSSSRAPPLPPHRQQPQGRPEETRRSPPQHRPPPPPPQQRQAPPQQRQAPPPASSQRQQQVPPPPPPPPQQQQAPPPSPEMPSAERPRQSPEASSSRRRDSSCVLDSFIF